MDPKLAASLQLVTNCIESEAQDNLSPTDREEAQGKLLKALQGLVEVRGDIGLETYPFEEFARGLEEVLSYDPDAYELNETTDDFAAEAGADDRVAVSVVSRTDYMVHRNQLALRADSELGHHLYEITHESGGWDSLLTTPGIDPIVRVVFVQETVSAITEGMLNTPLPDPAIVQVIESNVLFVDSGQWGPLPPPAPAD